MKALFNFVDRGLLGRMLALIVLQQFLVAFGTYALAKAGFHYDDPKTLVWWLFISLCLYLTTPVFGIYIRRLESKMCYFSYNIFLQESLFSKAGQSSLWQNKAEKEKFLASIGEHTNDYLGFMIFTCVDIFSFSLSIIFGVFSIGLALEWSIIPAFIVSALLSAAAYKLCRPKVEWSFQEDQKGRTQLSALLLRCWDMNFLNNKSVHQAYQGIYLEKLQHAAGNSIRSSTWAESLVFLLGLVAGLPVLISTCWIIWNLDLKTESHLLVALLATLPRQLNILGIFRSIFQSMANLLGAGAKLQVIRSGAQLAHRNLEDSIRLSDMVLNGNVETSLHEFSDFLRTVPKGRIEIRGPNGCGKSTLLLKLNGEIGSSFYLPSYPNLLVAENASRSTGENLMAHLEYIKTIPEQVIMLDEWDANLDADNRASLDRQIGILSLTKTIVEIRHRESN